MTDKPKTPNDSLSLPDKIHVIINIHNEIMLIDDELTGLETEYVRADEVDKIVNNLIADHDSIESQRADKDRKLIRDLRDGLDVHRTAILGSHYPHKFVMQLDKIAIELIARADARLNREAKENADDKTE